MTCTHCENILNNLTYTNKEPPEYEDRFWKVHDMLVCWNKNMAKMFLPSWMNCIDKSMSKWVNEYVEKLQFSLFLISCCPEILNSSWVLWYLLLKIACLHVSFTAHENFYKLSKMHCLLIWVSTFQPSEVSENRDPTIKHISIYTLISSSISTYVMDLFLVILSTS